MVVVVIIGDNLYWKFRFIWGNLFSRGLNAKKVSKIIILFNLLSRLTRHEGKLSTLRIIQVIISHCIASFDFHTRPRGLDTRSILAFSTAISTFVRLWHLISNYVHCWSAPSIDIRWSNTYNYIAYLNVINMFRVRILFNASYAYRVNEPCFILSKCENFEIEIFLPTPIVYQTYPLELYFSTIVVTRSLSFWQKKKVEIHSKISSFF